MIPITVALTAEHKTFLRIFDQAERKLPQVQTAIEVRKLGRKVEDMLRRHTKAEEDLLLMAQSAAAEFRNRYARCLRHHHEIAAQFVQLHTAHQATRAKTLLKEALKHSRKHLTYEERFVFPLIEQVLNSKTLTKLGSMWFLSHPSFQGVTSARYLAA